MAGKYIGVSSEVAKAIQAHVPLERMAETKYLSFALIANRKGYFGVEKFFRSESANERGHMIKFLDLINDFDFESVAVPAADAAPVTDDEMLDLFVTSLGMEQTVTASINHMLQIAHATGDGIAINFLLEFAQEQMTSEIEYRDIINRYTMSANNMAEFDEYVGELA